MQWQQKLYSYVVDHDTGLAPNPYFGVCTLCLCKYRRFRKGRRNVVELAEVGDWIVGTGGANLRKSAGNGKLVYAMRVDGKLTRDLYYARFPKKRGDNKRPATDFEKHEQYALVSRQFYYFGANAVRIPERFTGLEKKGPGFKRKFTPAYVKSFVEWLKKNHKLGRQGEPCQAIRTSQKSGCNEALASSPGCTHPARTHS